MGVQVESGGKGGKKQLVAELNLVPFIDLLCCCISFLLITAVWTQLARIDVKQKGQGKAGEEMMEKPPEEQLKITVLVESDGLKLQTTGAGMTPIPLENGKHNYAKLSEELKKLKAAYPDKNDIHLATEDGVLYEIIVETMDACLQAEFQEMSLTDTGAAPL